MFTVSNFTLNWLNFGKILSRVSQLKVWKTFTNLPKTRILFWPVGAFKITIISHCFFWIISILWCLFWLEFWQMEMRRWIWKRFNYSTEQVIHRNVTFEKSSNRRFRWIYKQKLRLANVFLYEHKSYWL